MKTKSNRALVAKKKLFLFAMAICASVALFAADVDIYLSQSSGWTEAGAKTAVYYFKSADDTQNGWTGYMATEVSNILKTAIPEGYDRIIFVRFDPARTDAISWTGTWGQTVNIALESGKNLYNITDDARDGEGKWKNGTWSVYAAPVEKDLVFKAKVPAGTTECYIAGDWNKDGIWVFKKMNTVDAIDHQFEYSATLLETFEYKYCAAASWDYVELTADDQTVPNRKNTGVVDEVAKFKAPAVAKWFIKGSFNEWKDGVELKGSDNTALTAKIALAEKAKIEFKILSVAGTDSTWYGLPSEGNIMKYGSCTDWVAYKSEGSSNQANVGLQATKAQDYTFTVNVTNKVDEKIAPKFSVDIPEPAPDPREKRPIVLVPGELKSDNPSMIIFAFTAGKEAYDVTMEVKKGGADGTDTVAYVAEIPKELDSLIFVRAETGASWSDLEWNGGSKKVWNQSEDYKLSADCDTASFVDWGKGEGAKFVLAWCGVGPTPPATAWYIKLPVAKDDWTWREMDEEANGTWAHQAKWVGGGANLNTSMDDATATYIKDEDMNFGENKVAPAEGTECTFVWDPVTKVLAVNYVAPQGIENISYQLDLNAPIYNVLGVEVDASFHGVVIQNGQKFIR